MTEKMGLLKRILGREKEEDGEPLLDQEINEDFPKGSEEFRTPPSTGTFPSQRFQEEDTLRPSFPASSSTDMNLIITKLELINQRLEVLDRRIQVIEKIARESQDE